MTIEEIFQPNRPIAEIIGDLSLKSIVVPPWGGKQGLEAQYNPEKHPVMDRAQYPDVVEKGRLVERVTRITYDYQRLAVNRMTELAFGVPVKRVYKAENDAQSEIARDIEAVYQRNRIDSFNLERSKMLFAGCEVVTLWYPVDGETRVYGFESDFKLRCANYSPMLGDKLYPLFDELGDLIALSIAYERKVGNKKVSYFDTYTAEKHYKWQQAGKSWEEVENDDLPIKKIPAVYIYRPTPIWEDTSKLVYEMEWAMSRGGNYLRRNSKPILGVFTDEVVKYGNEKDENEEFRTIMQLPKGAEMKYITWDQQVENLKFFITENRQSFFTQLQLPDWSYESMKSAPMSGESRKQLFIDAMLKVKEESGRWLEAFDREMNVVKAFYKLMKKGVSEEEVDNLQVETVITPYVINDDKERAELALTLNGNKPLMSHRESIEFMGLSDDVETTLQEIQQDELNDAAEPSL